MGGFQRSEGIHITFCIRHVHSRGGGGGGGINSEFLSRHVVPISRPIYMYVS